MLNRKKSYDWKENLNFRYNLSQISKPKTKRHQNL